MDDTISTSAAADAASYMRVKLQSLPTFARELLAGGLAGGLAKTCVAPLERTKIIFQTRGGSSVLGVLQHIWVQEGLPGLFRGNSASVLRIVPYAAIHFGSYEYFRRGIVRLASDAGDSPQQQYRHQHLPLWDLLAGSASGATAVVTTYPLDLVRTRLAWAIEAPPSATGAGAGRPRVPGIWSTLATTAREEGLSGLYRGVSPTLLGILPYAGLKFYVYQALKNVYRSWAAAQAHEQQQPAQQQQQQQVQQQQQQQVQQQHHNHKPPMSVTLMIGGLAGLVAQTLTFPLDVVRRHMQVQHLRDRAPADPRSSSSSSSSSSRPAAAAAAPGLPAPADATRRGAASAAGSSTTSSSPSLQHNSSSSSSRQASSAPTQLRGTFAHNVAAAADRQREGSSSSSSSSGRDQRPPVTGSRVAAGGSSLRAGALQQQWRLAHHLPGPVAAPRLTTLSVTRALLREGGVRALFRGLSINYMKVVPSTAIGFSLYDALKGYLGLSGTL